MAPIIPPTALPSGIPTRQDIIDLENDSCKYEGINDGRHQRFEKQYRTQISTTVASLASIMVSHPLDTVKTKMQSKDFHGLLNCVRETYRQHGLKEFYKGVTSPIGSQTLVRIISMSTYQKAKYAYSAYFHRNYGTDPLVSANTPGEYPNIFTVACFSGAGATAGFMVTFVSCPFELSARAAQLASLMAERQATGIKEVPIVKSSPPTPIMSTNGINARPIETVPTALVRDRSADYLRKGPIQIARTIVRNRGFMGLYTGFRLHQLRDTIGTGLYFASYETTKQAYNAFRGTTAPSSPSSVIVASTICGITSWALIYPIDTVKTKYQRDCLVLEKGHFPPMPRIVYFDRRVYRGLAVSICRSVVTAVAFFSVFEAMKKRINALEDYNVE